MLFVSIVYFIRDWAWNVVCQYCLLYYRLHLNFCLSALFTLLETEPEMLFVSIVYFLETASEMLFVNIVCFIRDWVWNVVCQYCLLYWRLRLKCRLSVLFNLLEANRSVENVTQFKCFGTTVTKIWLGRKLRGDWIRVMLPTIHYRTFCLLICCLKTWKLGYTKS
jgi:hypothetical protein